MRISALALLLFCTLFGGCYFDHPLTGAPSKDINSWLLGVWEHKDAKGKVYRARVVPLTGDRYFVSFQTSGRKTREKKVWEFEGWISRVGNSRFLSLKCNASSGEVPEGAFVFVNYQVVDQNTVVVRPLQLDSSPETSSRDLRAEVRQRLKEQSLMPAEGAKWARISEIYWERGYTGEQPFQPLRFPAYPTPPPVNKPKEERKPAPELLPLSIPQ
jgi:hypothetical protein